MGFAGVAMKNWIIARNPPIIHHRGNRIHRPADATMGKSTGHPPIQKTAMSHTTKAGIVSPEVSVIRSSGQIIQSSD